MLQDKGLCISLVCRQGSLDNPSWWYIQVYSLVALQCSSLHKNTMDYHRYLDKESLVHKAMEGIHWAELQFAYPLGLELFSLNQGC